MLALGVRGGASMTEKSDEEVTLFIRDQMTGRYVFNAKALKALGVDPTEARERGYPLKEPEEPKSNLVA
jgi:hypothetical protein